MHVGRKSAAVGALALVTLVAGLWEFGRPKPARQRDVSARRSVYSAFPVFPGATMDHERSYEIRSEDSDGTGRYGLAVTYRLPATATSADVVEFLRSNSPPGWHEATDETCARLQARAQGPPRSAPVVGSPPPGPPPTVSSAPLVLTRRDDELTIFTAHGDDAADGTLSGLTFRISRSGQDAFLTLDGPTFGCQPITQGR